MCRRILLLVLACISVFTGTAIASCFFNKYQNGLQGRMICSNLSSLNTAIISSGLFVSDIIIFQSQIENIPNQSFIKYSKSLISLNIHDCGIREISDYAFAGLTYLRKLGLSYNNITTVKDQWFTSLISLEELDLSYSHIALIEPTAFEKLRGLKQLDIRGNRLTCLDPFQLVPMAAIKSIRLSGNPLTFQCRGTLTLWLRDMGIVYKDVERGQEHWLDSLLWLCATDAKVADSEVLMKECVLINLFNQLRTGLTTAESFPLSIPQECTDARNELMRCIVTDRKNDRDVITNGYVMRKLLRNLYESKSTV